MVKQYKKLYAKMLGQNYVVQTHVCSKSSFGILKRSAELELPLGILNFTFIGPVKTDLCHPYYSYIYYTIEQL